MTATLSIKDLQVIEGEAHVLDLRLAEALGFARARDIRKLFTRNESELAAYGRVTATLIPESARHGGALHGAAPHGVADTEYQLNEPQAILICMFARTPRAAEARTAIVQAFIDWRRGQVRRIASENINPGRVRHWKFAFAQAAVALDEMGVDVGAIDMKAVVSFGRYLRGGPKS